MIDYPSISPVIFSLGPFELRWYSLAYLGGIGLGTFIFRRLFKEKFGFNTSDLLDFMSYLMAGILIGGRVGYVLFYDVAYYLAEPQKILAIWNGGMSYHGGAAGSVIALYLFSKAKRINFLEVLDILGIGSTLGIGFGRIANFINGELYGRETTVPWGMVFPNGGPIVRHPSQLYEAFLEGVVLFACLYIVMKTIKLAPGYLFCLYLIGYGGFRFICEFYREPDPQLGLLWLNLSMGQWLCVAMISLGVLLGVTFRPKKA